MYIELINENLLLLLYVSLFQMIILPFIPILALIVQTSLILQEILDYRAEVADIETQVSDILSHGPKCLYVYICKRT